MNPTVRSNNYTGLLCLEQVAFGTITPFAITVAILLDVSSCVEYIYFITWVWINLLLVHSEPSPKGKHAEKAFHQTSGALFVTANGGND